MKIYLQPLVKTFRENANADDALWMSNYMRNQFEFLGIKTDKRKRLQSDFLDTNGWPAIDDFPELAREAWEMPEREFQYFGLEIVEKRIKKMPADFIETIEYMILTKSWWDTVDGVAPRLAGELFKRFPERIIPVTSAWIESENIWLQRSAILFQLKYKKETDTHLLFDYILRRADTKEFFVQKAMGWALRQYARTNSEIIVQFVKKNRQSLPKLTQREALKRLKSRKVSLSYH